MIQQKLEPLEIELHRRMTGDGPVSMEHPYSIAKQHETFFSIESMARTSWLSMRLPPLIFPLTIFGWTSADAEIYTSAVAFKGNKVITCHSKQTDCAIVSFFNPFIKQIGRSDQFCCTFFFHHKPLHQQFLAKHQVSSPSALECSIG